MKKTVQQFVTDIEKELLIQVMTSLDQKKITDDRAQHLAQDFLYLLPVKNKRTLVLKMRTLASHYKEASKVYFELAETIYKEEKLRKGKLASKYIKLGEIEKAVKTIKGGFYG